MGVDVDIIFGRLYYHLEKKYSYKRQDGSRVCLFTPVAGKDRNCVNFPLMASVLADLRRKNRKYKIGIIIAVLTVIISIIAIVV